MSATTPICAVVALTLLALAAGTAAAQTIDGRVIDADYGQPVSEARILLLDRTGAALDSTTTGPEGRFRLIAPAPGRYLLHVDVEAYFSYSQAIRLGSSDTAGLTIEMPVLSEAAGRAIRQTIDREAALQLPLEELCHAPLRPWEAGVLVGVARTRQDLRPVPRAVTRIERIDPDERAGPPSGSESEPRSRVATAAGTYWFCNLAPGRVRVVTTANGFAADTSYATIRAGTVSWFDSLLRRRR